MASTPLSAPTAGTAPLWDAAEGRRLPGGALIGDSVEPTETPSFRDVLSIVNPLQHIPIVSSIYRWVTGDTITPVARVIGGGLFGGPFGLIAAAFNAVVEQVKGRDLGEQVLAALAPGAAAEGEAHAAAPASDPAPPVLVAPSERATPIAAAARSDSPSPRAAAQGRTLASYQAQAGQTRAADLDRSARPIEPAAARLPGAGPRPGAALAISETPMSEAARPTQKGPPADWFAASMLQGLDRYRAMQRLERSQPQLDMMQ